MKIFSELCRRLPWVNVAAGTLVVLLQRTPAVRVFAQVSDYALTSRAGELLRAMVPLAALGTVHAQVGATTFQTSTPSPVRGRVGQQLDFAFTYTGTPSPPATFQVSGTLPPGLRFVPTPLGSTIRSGTPAVTGTPTQAGVFTIMVQGFNAEGLTNNIQQTIIFDIEGSGGAAPTITTQPQSQTVTVNANVTFSVAASGTPSPTFQWTRNGANIAGATGASLNLPAVQLADAGAYAVIVTNAGGSVTSATATLIVNPAGGGGAAPAIIAPPLGFTAAAGSTAAFTVVASGNGNLYEWQRNGGTIAGATDATLLVPAVSAVSAGDYRVIVRNGGGSVTSSPATLRVQTGQGRLANLSVRTSLAASQKLIVGFSTNGTKRVLLRGVGPTLGAFGVVGAYTDPRLELYNGSAAMITQNDNWGGGAELADAFNAVGAFSLANASRDAALQAEITGSHSAHLTGPNSGVVLVEVYDSGGSTGVRLVNVSARNIVGTADNILIAGFVVDGTVAKTLLIRAVGPTLAGFGVEGTLVDPKLEIFSGTTKIVENDNWSASARGTFTAVGAFDLATGSRDAALLVSLMPGAYSAQVSGADGGTGEALVEVYEVP